VINTGMKHLLEAAWKDHVQAMYDFAMHARRFRDSADKLPFIRLRESLIKIEVMHMTRAADRGHAMACVQLASEIRHDTVHLYQRALDLDREEREEYSKLDDATRNRLRNFLARAS